jgi:hypothetical protein
MTPLSWAIIAFILMALFNGGLTYFVVAPTQPHYYYQMDILFAFAGAATFYCLAKLDKAEGL